jgi:hypothetical protein
MWMHLRCSLERPARSPALTVPVERIHPLRPEPNEMQVGSGVLHETLCRPEVNEMLFYASGMPE